MCGHAQRGQAFFLQELYKYFALASYTYNSNAEDLSMHVHWDFPFERSKQKPCTELAWPQVATLSLHIKASFTSCVFLQCPSPLLFKSPLTTTSKDYEEIWALPTPLYSTVHLG